MKEAAKAWGEGKEVEWQDVRGRWHPVNEYGHAFTRGVEYRLKPEVTTSLSNEDLHKEYYRAFGLPDYRPNDSPSANMFDEALRAVADLALKQYIKEQGK